MQSVGFLDEDFFFFGEETDWCRRFRNAGWRVVFAPVGDIVHFGGASCSSLGAERDLMLTNSIVRYHQKHMSRGSGLFVYCLLFVFNATRFLYWSIVPAKLGGLRKRERRKLFLDIVGNYRKAWPNSELRDSTLKSPEKERHS